MRWSLLAVLMPALAAARPVWRPPAESTERMVANAVAELSADIRARDAGAIGKRLAAPFNAGPLWFPDAACPKQFGAGGLVGVKQAPVLARCLAKLDLQLSTRKSALRDGAVLTAKPGFEIEVAFQAAGQVRWLASPAHAHGEPARPMLTAQAFEALRTHGSTQLDATVAHELEGELGSRRSVSAWLKVCLDASGKLAQTSVLSSSSTRTGEVFVRAIGDWQFQPLTLRGRPVPACSLSQLTYPAALAEAVETLPSSGAPATTGERELEDFVEIDLWGAPPPPPPPSQAVITARTLESLRRRGSSLVAPDPKAKKELGTQRTIASAKVCIDAVGMVSSVTLIRASRSPAWNAQIERAARAWIFRPYMTAGSPQPACAILTFTP